MIIIMIVMMMIIMIITTTLQSPGSRNSPGRSALHLACLLGGASVLDSLLQAKADPGAKDDTVLMGA